MCVNPNMCIRVFFVSTSEKWKRFQISHAAKFQLTKSLRSAAQHQVLPGLTVIFDLSVCELSKIVHFNSSKNFPQISTTWSEVPQFPADFTHVQTWILSNSLKLFHTYRSLSNNVATSSRKVSFYFVPIDLKIPKYIQHDMTTIQITICDLINQNKVQKTLKLLTTLSHCST